MKLPLFPLNLCLLPDGYTQLRIFEPRYKRLVVDSLKSGFGFGLIMLDASQDMVSVGTQVQITDFETLDDGLLGITIKGESRFKLISYNVDEDGLKQGIVERLPNWQSQPVSISDQDITHKLREILAQYPEHLNHYDDECFDDISWACQRWLEILPLSPEQKKQCIQASNHRPSLHILKSLI